MDIIKRHISLLSFFAFIVLIAYFSINIMVKEQALLMATGRYGDPAMLWAKVEGHRDVIQQSVFKVKETRAIYGEMEEFCVRPAWPAMVGRRANELRACDDSEWKSFGSSVVVKNITKLTGGGGREEEKYSLFYMDKVAPILEPHRYIVNIAFGGSKHNLEPSQVVLQFGGGKCNVTLVSGKAFSCGEKVSVQTIEFLDGKERANRKTIASMSISKEGVISFESRQGMKYSGGKKMESDDRVELVCPTPVAPINKNGIERLVALQAEQHNLSIWCSKDAKVPTSELERLAVLMQQVRAEKGSLSEIVTTFSSSVDQRLRDIVGRIKCTGQCDAQITMMDAFSGNVRGIVSTKAINDAHSKLGSPATYRLQPDKLEIDNFSSQSPGSIAKIVFSKAILATIPELHTFTMFKFDGDQCRLLDVKLSQFCKESDDAAIAGSYQVISHSKDASLDFPNFIAQSENVYATSLFFLGNTVPLEDGGCRVEYTSAIERGWSKVAPKSAYGKNATIVPWGQTMPVTYREWLNNRVALFNEGMEIGGKARAKCAPGKLPLWHNYMVKKMNIFNREDNNDRYRSYIWGPDLKKRFAGTEKLSPEREFIGFDNNKLNNSFYDDPYKWVYGGGDYKWSNISIAEQVSSIVAKRHIMANIVKVNDHQEFERFEENEVLAANQILKGMKLVINNGTAKRLCVNERLSNTNAKSDAPINCPRTADTIHKAAFIKHPDFGNLELLAKTGTPSKLTWIVSNDKLGLWDIFVKVSSDQGKAYSKDWCNGNEMVRIGSRESRKDLPKESICKLQGDEVVELIDHIANRISLSNQSRKARWDKTYVYSEFRRWLTAELDRSTKIRESEQDARSKGFQENNVKGKDGSEKRMVLVVGQPMSNGESNSYKHACTFMISINEEAGEKHFILVKKLIDNIVGDKNNLLLSSCGFMAES